MCVLSFCYFPFPFCCCNVGVSQMLAYREREIVHLVVLLRVPKAELLGLTGHVERCRERCRDGTQGTMLARQVLCYWVVPRFHIEIVFSLQQQTSFRATQNWTELPSTVLGAESSAPILHLKTPVRRWAGDGLWGHKVHVSDLATGFVPHRFPVWY